jgi:hypothetical protein
MPKSSIEGIAGAAPPKVARTIRNLGQQLGPGGWQAYFPPEPPSLPWEPLRHVGDEDTGGGCRMRSGRTGAITVACGGTAKASSSRISRTL